MRCNNPHKQCKEGKCKVYTIEEITEYAQHIFPKYSDDIAKQTLNKILDIQKNDPKFICKKTKQTVIAVIFAELIRYP